MDKEIIDKLTSSGHTSRRLFRNDEVILPSGSRTQDSYYIRKGYVKVYDINHDGTIKIIGILNHGQMFPLIWAFDHPPETVYYYKAMGEVETDLVNTIKLKLALTSDDKLSREAMMQFIYLTWDFMERIKGLQMPYTYEKLVRLLPYLAAKIGKKVSPNSYELQHTLTQEEIAQMTGVTRESVSAHMSKVEKNNLIKRRNGKLIVNLSAIPEEFIHKLWFRETSAN